MDSNQGLISSDTNILNNTVSLDFGYVLQDKNQVGYPFIFKIIYKIVSKWSKEDETADISINAITGFISSDNAVSKSAGDNTTGTFVLTVSTNFSTVPKDLVNTNIFNSYLSEIFLMHKFDFINNRRTKSKLSQNM